MCLGRGGGVQGGIKVAIEGNRWVLLTEAPGAAAVQAEAGVWAERGGGGREDARALGRPSPRGGAVFFVTRKIGRIQCLGGGGGGR